MKINYLEMRAAKICLPFTAPHTQNRKDVNRISFLNRGYAFICLVAVLKVNILEKVKKKKKKKKKKNAVK